MRAASQGDARSAARLGSGAGSLARESTKRRSNVRGVRRAYARSESRRNAAEHTSRVLAASRLEHPHRAGCAARSRKRRSCSRSHPRTAPFRCWPKRAWPAFAATSSRARQAGRLAGGGQGHATARVGVARPRSAARARRESGQPLLAPQGSRGSRSPSCKRSVRACRGICASLWNDPRRRSLRGSVTGAAAHAATSSAVRSAHALPALATASAPRWSRQQHVFHVSARGPAARAASSRILEVNSDFGVSSISTA